MVERNIWGEGEFDRMRDLEALTFAVGSGADDTVARHDELGMHARKPTAESTMVVFRRGGMVLRTDGYMTRPRPWQFIVYTRGIRHARQMSHGHACW